MARVLPAILVWMKLCESAYAMKLCVFLRLPTLAATILLASGCETPRTRARLHPEAFAKLSAANQRLVLAGKVRDGMNTDAVYIAWGEPDEKRPATGGQEPTESWLYHRQITVQAPMESFDQWSVGTSVFGATVPLATNAGFGFGGIGNEGELLYQPHLRIADASVKEADFRGGRLEDHREYRSEFTLPR